MEIIQAIALLCQIHSGSISTYSILKVQEECHRYYLHCVSVKQSSMLRPAALEKCILEKK